ncbi:hypothetical protein DPX16_0777 [Anabarilius grahami]|uniref:Uncharacterized protein n=1 Tax=Anabarilius grahami TaxID=495550 RepID=A0A3N0XEQ4_ANAGA|nr:hypothetical protein DPX16_0777 [Anabarilius grahami]
MQNHQKTSGRRGPRDPVIQNLQMKHLDTEEQRDALAGSGLTEDEETKATSGPDEPVRAGGVMEGLVHDTEPFPGSTDFTSYKNAQT